MSPATSSRRSSGRSWPRTVDCLARTVAAARLPPEDLVGVFLVGGSSRIPLAARMIHQALGVAPTTLEQPETAVAEGVLCLDGPAAYPPPPTPVAPMSPAAPHPQSGLPYPQSVPPSPYTVPPGTGSPGTGSPGMVSAPPSGALPLSGPLPLPARPWYAEPGLWGVVVLSVLVAVAAAVLIWLLATG